MPLAPPQLVVDSRMVLCRWLPADPVAAAATLPAGLRARSDGQVFMNQYVVDDETQTSGFGAYSLTYLGVSLDGLDAPDGITPGGWWTHFLTTSSVVGEYSAAVGAPVSPGSTTVEVRRDRLVAVTEVDGVPIIRTRARVGHISDGVRRGQHRYVTRRDGRLVSGLYPYIAEPVTPFEVESIEFLAPDHPAYLLRPANPLTIVSGFYTPRSSFVYPGGEAVLD